jgi:acetyl coenzyme A synthetase (ADP forming)-like protein
MSGGPGGIESVFRPRSVAVIGASRERGSIGAEIFHNLLEHGFAGAVYPVNPKAQVVQSVRAYPTVSDLPEAPELAVVVVPAPFVAGVLEACGQKGVKAAIVISAGFKETGGEGMAREAELTEVVRRHGMRLIGPNCLGVLNTESAIRMDATFAPTYPPAGHVALSSQSGALGLAILDLAKELNVGISHFASVGNKADVSANDLIEFWETDPGTSVILLYLESFGNPRRFIEIARRVGLSKPIVAVKSGRTRAGARAASSHTGSLAGADTAVDALCTQCGVTRVDTMEELFDVAMLLANQPVPRGNRVGIVTNAGGPGIMASDACETHGMEVPILEDATMVALRGVLAKEASVRNPVDMIASASPASYEKCVELVARDPRVDAVMVLYVPPIVTTPEEVADAIVRGTQAARAAAASGEAAKPVLACFMGSHGVAEGMLSLQESHIPSYTFPESAAMALARAVRYGRWQAEPAGKAREFKEVDRAAASQVLAGARRRAAPSAADAGGPAAAGASAAAAGARAAGANSRTWLTPEETCALLGAYGIACAGSRFAASADEAAAAGRAVGFPVAIKLASPTITHKSDIGGVVLDVRDEKAAREAYEGIARRLAEKGVREQMSGVTVQAMVEEGVETIVGMTLDRAFGPLLMFGLGGVNVELLKDVAFRVQPLTDRDAREMVHSVRGFPLLEGYRGAPACDVAAIEETLLRLSQMLGEQEGIVEMDLNPLKALAPGRGCVVVDARVAVVAGAATPGASGGAKVRSEPAAQRS